MVDAVLQLQIKPPGQQQIVKTRTQQQQILQLKTGGHQAEVHIGAAVVSLHRMGATDAGHPLIHQKIPDQPQLSSLVNSNA